MINCIISTCCFEVKNFNNYEISNPHFSELKYPSFCINESLNKSVKNDEQMIFSQTILLKLSMKNTLMMLKSIIRVSLKNGIYNLFFQQITDFC